MSQAIHPGLHQGPSIQGKNEDIGASEMSKDRCHVFLSVDTEITWDSATELGNPQTWGDGER